MNVEEVSIAVGLAIIAAVLVELVRRGLRDSSSKKKCLKITVEYQKE